MGKTKSEIQGWQAEGCGKLVFDVNIELLLEQAKARSEQEYNSWCNVIDTFVEEIERLKKS